MKYPSLVPDSVCRTPIHIVLEADELDRYGDPLQIFEADLKCNWQDSAKTILTGEQKPDGEVGELVITSLCKEAMPILRYRTRDLTTFIPGECPCGRRHMRMGRIVGRADDMFICKGVNIYPSQIEEVLMKFKEVGKNYLITLEDDGLGDLLRVKVEIREECFVEDMRALQGLQQRIARRLKDEILVTPKVDLVQSNSLPVPEGKAVRFKDLRGEKQ